VSAILEETAKLERGLLDDPRLVAAAHAIDGEAAALDDRTLVQPQAVRTSVQPIDWQAESHDLVDFATGMIFPLYPRLAGVWTPERCRTLETRLAAVLKKYNLDLGTLLGKWGPEIMLAAAIAPAVLPTVKAIRTDHAEHKAQQQEKDRAAPPAGRTDVQPPPAVRTSEQGPAAPPDPVKLHELVRTGEEASRMAPPPPDQTQLHIQA
jgi:hypothetical protein